MPEDLSVLENQKKFENTTKLQMAKKELNSIQEKFKRFREKSREYTQRRHQSRVKKDINSPIYATQAQNQNSFLPDLKQYFSFMMQKENQPLYDNIKESQKGNSQINFSNNETQKQKQNLSQKIQQHQKRSIEDKLSQQKNIAITNLEEFFTNKKSQLDSKVLELQQAKAKAIQDIHLLKRNNSQLQTQIDIEKNIIYNNATESLREKNKQILQKIQSKKRAIQNLKNSVQKINSKKQQLRKNINQCLRGNKNFIAQDALNQQF